MKKDKQLAIALFCGMDQDHPLVQDAVSGDDAAESPADMSGIGKEDFFSAVGLNSSFFAHHEAWASIDMIIKHCHERGEDITGQDMVSPIDGGKTAIGFALDLDKMGHAFRPEIWKGQMEEMEKAWFGMPKEKRDKCNYMDIKRLIANSSGMELREDILDEMGVSIFVLRSAVRTGDYENTREKFARHNDYLRADDILIPDAHGDHMLDNDEAWKNFEALCKELARHNERFEVRHFTLRHEGRRSFVEHALSARMAEKIFNADLWRGRTDDLLAVHRSLPEEKQRPLLVKKVLAELEHEEHETSFSAVGIKSEKDLQTVFNQSACRALGEGVAVRPLGLSVVWNNIGAIAKSLESKGEAITLSSLRLKTGYEGDTCLMRGARFGKFKDVLAILDKNGETLSVDDLICLNDKKESVLNILAARGETDLVLAPERWMDRMDDFYRLWEAAAKNSRSAVDFQDVLGRINMLSLRRKFADRPLGLEP